MGGCKQTNTKRYLKVSRFTLSPTLTHCQDGVEAPDEHLLVAQALGGRSERYHHGGKNPLRHVGDNDTDHNREVGHLVCGGYSRVKSKFGQH